MDESHARAMLEALVRVPGSLRVITNEPAKGGGKYPVTDPRHFVIHDVTALEGIPARPHMLRAVTAEGDYCEGRPSALLTRLQEWRV